MRRRAGYRQKGGGLPFKVALTSTMWEALEVVGAKEPIGRRRLAAEMNLTVAEARNVLEALEYQKLVQPTPKGHELTIDGRTVLDFYASKRSW